MNITSSSDLDSYRLPTNVKPFHYDLIVKTDLEQLTFEGFVKISLEAKEETSELVLHAAHLQLRKASVHSNVWSSEKTVEISSIDETQERVTYKLPRKLTAGSKADLKISFAGTLTGSMMGYYRARWEIEGKTQYYALTQFEATAARRAFPCWDEPLLKATFAVTLISRIGTVNLGNMSVLSEEPVKEGINTYADLTDILASTRDGEWKITKFDTSPPMSSYIVAFANGPFVFIEGSVTMPLSGKTIPLRIYSTPDLVHQAQFVLNVKRAALPLYEELFDVEYPLPKLDTLVASDFDPLAMENWGLITGRPSAFLIDPERPDIRAMKDVMSTQSHEIAHMWFGNITTLEWWTYTYLNEGFATLMSEVFFCDKVYPQWRIGTEFINKNLSRALKLDAKLSSHPIEVDAPDPNTINQACSSTIFDNLSYSKAASVLLMLSSYVGEERFLKGVSIYLKKKLFANSVTRDLWDGISAATGIDITDLMDTWITKIGFPVVTVTEDAEGITVRQDRFLETGPALPEDNKTLWNVPLTILTVKDGKSVIDRAAMLKERQKTIALDTNKPFKLNTGTKGVYRVLYTPERLSLIAADAIKENSVFSLEDRMGLVHDTMALSKAGLSKLSSALAFVVQLKNEKEYLVWQAISENLSDVQDIWWEFLAITTKFQEFRRSLFAPLVDKLGYEYPPGEALEALILRTLAIEQAYDADDEGVITELRNRFKVYQVTEDDSKIPADLQNVIYSAATRYGGHKEYEAMVKIYHNPKSPTEQNAAILAMGITQDDSLLEKTFDFILSKARDQDIITFFVGLAKNYKARRMLTKYMKDKYDQLFERFEGTMSFSGLLPRAIQFYSTQKDCDDINAYFKDKDTSRYNQSLAQALDSIRARSACVERSTQDLKQWLIKI